MMPPHPVLEPAEPDPRLAVALLLWVLGLPPVSTEQRITGHVVLRRSAFGGQLRKKPARNVENTRLAFNRWI